MNINGWEGMLFIEINAAISVQVSNELGSGNPRAAEYCVMVVVTVSFNWNYFNVHHSDHQEPLAYLLGITLVLSSVQPVISGVAVGGGWQGLVAYINLFCYCIIGLPLGFFLGYKTRLGVEGIWIGMICGPALQTFILVIIVCKTNWTDEVEQASERMRQWVVRSDDENSDDKIPLPK